ncbi:MAG: nicotinate-nucleotide--dimethylbenzimidazole phosphoribosyltransferase [Bacteroidales bacterium]|nr:nicotinate-nucleotide--dimethylbenzimidazole phosphoribosyltransferase [Bacteroidales bacterium]
MGDLQEQLQHKIDYKTKPLGALGQLESLALQIGLVQKTLSPSLVKPTILLFAADHGIADEGVSAYPKDVTYQMVSNFLNKGAAINVFCRQNGLNLKLIDAGVDFDFGNTTGIINKKIARGTKNFLHDNAMSHTQLLECLNAGASVVKELHNEGCNVIGCGEMGIGNTSSSSMIMSCLTDIPLKKCVGKGTGLDNSRLNNKLSILQQAMAFHGPITDPMKVMETYGGFEICQMCGAMIEAYKNDMLILVDGFIATNAFLVAYKMNPQIKRNAIFCHQSDEQGHKALLEYLDVKALLDLNVRVGEGTGCALAYPLVRAAVAFLNEMDSFEGAGVSNKR